MTILHPKTAVLIIDMQQGFLRDESAMGRIGFDLALLREAVEPCVRVVAAAREAGALLIYTRYVFAPDHSDGGLMVELVPALRTEGALRAGEWEVELISQLRPAEGEIVIDKNRPSAFWNTGLDALLREHGIERIVVAGITTNCCVESTVRDASHRDIDTWLVTDAVAESDRERHHYAVRGMTMLFARGVTVAELEGK